MTSQVSRLTSIIGRERPRRSPFRPIASLHSFHSGVGRIRCRRWSGGRCKFTRRGTVDSTHTASGIEWWTSPNNPRRRTFDRSHRAERGAPSHGSMGEPSRKKVRRPTKKKSQLTATRLTPKANPVDSSRRKATAATSSKERPHRTAAAAVAEVEVPLVRSNPCWC
jgi:hypothetical protein